MNFISRLPFPKSNPLYRISPNFNIIHRNYSLPAKLENSSDDEEAVMIDQRRLPADYNPAKFDPTEHRSPPTDRVFRLVDEVTSLTLIEISLLSEIMMKKLGMTQPPTVGVMKPGSAGMAASSGNGNGNGNGNGGVKEEAKVEKTVFEVKLESFEAAAKIKIIKEVRSFTELGLKEAKELVEKAPTVIKSGVSKEEGEKIVEKLKALGSKAVLE